MFILQIYWQEEEQPRDEDFFESPYMVEEFDSLDELRSYVNEHPGLGRYVFVHSESGHSDIIK